MSVSRSPIPLRIVRGRPAILILAGAGLLGTGCTESSAIARDAEVSVFASVLEDWCAPDQPAIVEDEVGGDGSFGSGLVAFVERQSGRTLPGQLERDFIRKNGEAVRLSAFLGTLPPGCSYMEPDALAAFTDTAAAFRRDWFPATDTDSLGDARLDTPSILRLSRVGFDTEVTTALLNMSFSGGFDFCWSDYVVLSRVEDRWETVERVNHIVC